TMIVVFSGWFLFRCRSFAMIRGMVGSLAHLSWEPRHTHILASLVVLSLPVALVEIWQFLSGDLLVPLRSPGLSFALMTGVMLAFTVAMFARFDYGFIYFQF